jgi:peptidoglycan-associated lipoprotein
MNTFLKLATVAAFALLSACASDETKDDTSGTSGSATSPYDGSTSGSGAGSVVGSPSATGGAGGSVPGGNVLYFEFDSSELNQEGTAVAEAWAAYLAGNAGTKVRLEGHADERGTREYNVGLGERRANAVVQALTSRGVSERQLSVSSFGEERPVAMGHDEAAWSQNRRVEIVQ